MNIKNSIKILNFTSVLFLFLGLVYFYLSGHFMGFYRDLIFREYIIEEKYLPYLNYVYLFIFWSLVSILSCVKIFNKFSYGLLINIFTFIALILINILSQLDYFPSAVLFVLFNLFGIFRFIIFLLAKSNRDIV